MVQDLVAVLADRFAADVLDEPLVHELELVVRGADVNLAVERLDHRLVLRPRFLQGLLGAFPGRLVEQIPVEMGDLPSIVPDHAREVVYPAHLAVSGQNSVFLLEGCLARFTVSRHFLGHPGKIVGMHDGAVGHLAAQQILRLVSKLFDIRGDILDRPALHRFPFEDHRQTAHEQFPLLDQGLVRCRFFQGLLGQAKFELVHDDRRKALQGRTLCFGKLARRGIENAHRTDVEPLLRPQRSRRVEPDSVLGADHRMVARPGIFRGIGHDKDVRALDGDRAQASIARGFRHLRAVPRLEPNAILVHEADGRHGDLE